MLVAAFAASRFPLLNSLGYECSAAVALILPLVPGLFLLKTFAPVGGGGGAALLQSAVPLGVALAVGGLNALFVRNCAPGEGLGWFLLLPVVGMAWVGSLAFFCAAAFRRRVRWYLLFVAAVLAHPLILGYVTPRVDSYNFIYGYFPGLTYDEVLRNAPTLALWRGITLVCAFALVGESGRNPQGILRP